MTVRGPIEPDQMGITLSHDHLLVDAWGIRELYEAILDNEQLALDEVRLYSAAGGCTICDPTNVGIARNPEALRRISEQSGVHVVMGSGWYRERVYPPYVFEEMPDQLADRLVRELLVGVDDTGIRAGFIGEIGTERGHITPPQERVFRAAARAHRRTGCPIMTHTTHWGELALEQLDLFADEGVDPNKVIISHLGDRIGISWWLPIAGRGAWLNIDNLAFVAGYAPLEVRADNVAELCAEGLVHQIMLSNDTAELGHLSSYGGPGYANVINNFLPLLRERGVTEEQIHTMLITNPAQAFAYDINTAGEREGVMSAATFRDGGGLR
jgi:predicted metal-dependent phosphotriesterase family hydrolase